MKSGKTVIVETLRWIAVLPAALLSGLLVTFPIHWIVLLIGLVDNPNESVITVNGKGLLASINPATLERFGYALFVPIAALTAGAMVAPRFKFQTGIVLAVLWGMLLGAAITLALSRGPFEWKMLLALCVGAAGLFCGLKMAHAAAETQ